MSHRLKIALLLLLQVGLPAVGEDAKSVQRQLSKLKSELAREEERQRALLKEEKALTAESEKLTSQMKEFSVKERELTKELTGLEKQLPVLEQELQALKAELHSRRKGLDDRLLAMYKLSRKRSSLSILAESTSVLQAASRARYISAISNRDWQSVEVVSKEAESVQREEEFLSVAKAQQVEKVSELKKLGEETSKKRFQVGSLLREVSSKQEEQRKVLEKLKQSAAELETLLASVMGSEEPTEDRLVTKSEPVQQNFEGRGLLPGKLVLPVKGQVVQRFGKQKLEEFSDMVFSKGFEFSGAIGGKVTPVANGKVILSQVLPGLGNVVIIDHGKRYYTLYGRLASVLCQVGSVVATKDPIGLLGEPDYKGRNLYFELRHKGQAVDPGKFLSGG